jgi:acetoin:2,6-dichlorophenolindophenol oxidoreductase subunit beta
MTHTEATIDAISREMQSDQRIFYMGQDVGRMGGSMQGTRSLFDQFGPRRVIDAPISESAMVGVGIGAALFGRRPIVEISFGEFLPAAMNQLINQAPNLHYHSAGAAHVPLVIRTRVGHGPYGGHPQDYSAWFTHVPGLKVVMPGHPSDAKGLMTAALRDGNPVLYFEPMSLSHGLRADVPAGEHITPIGSARKARTGGDVTIVAVGSMVPEAILAADALANEGAEADVIDLHSLRPWDSEMVLSSVHRTHRLVIAHEAWVSGGFGAEVAAVVAEHALTEVHAPILRVGAKPVPIPSGPLRRHALPTSADILAAAQRVLSTNRKK